MSGRREDSMHPDLEAWYDTSTDRAVLGAHLANCPECRAWLAAIDERLRDLPCNEFVELVTGYLDDALDDGLRARVGDHLRLCEGCRSYLEQMRRTLATIGSPACDAEPPEPVRAGLLAAFRAWRPGHPGRTGS